MRQLFCYLLLFSFGRIYAQNANDVCTYHYFKTGGISSAECYKNNSSFGKSTAYNKKGVIIYEKAIRKVGGHSYVLFDYFDDGAVKRAEWRDDPDGGIQWYSSVTTFSEDGNVLSDHEQDYNTSPTTIMKTRPGTPQTQPVPTKLQPSQTMKCAVIYSSEFWFINTTGNSLIIKAESKSKGGSSFTVNLKPGTTARGGSWILAERFENPYGHYNISIESAKQKKGRMPEISFLKDTPDPDSKEKRRYYFTIQ